MPGAKINVEKMLEARELQDRAQLLNTTPPEELIHIFDESDIVGLNAYQWSIFDRQLQSQKKGITDKGLAGSPLPQQLVSRYPGQTNLLTHNKSFYEDTVEDIIAEDKIVQFYIPKTRSIDPSSNVEAMDVLRARRTTIAYLDYIGASVLRPLIVVQEAA